MPTFESCKDYLQLAIGLVVIYLVLKECMNYDLLDMFTNVDPFDNDGSIDTADVGKQFQEQAEAPGIHAAEASDNSDFQSVSYPGRTASTCYPQKDLKAEDLLPSGESKAIQEFNISKPVGEGILQGVNLLDSAYHVGVNTVGQSLRNANRQLRSEPPNPQVAVSPWMTSTINPDLPRRPLEVGESCPA